MAGLELLSLVTAVIYTSVFLVLSLVAMTSTADDATWAWSGGNAAGSIGTSALATSLHVIAVAALLLAVFSSTATTSLADEQCDVVDTGCSVLTSAASTFVAVLHACLTAFSVGEGIWVNILLLTGFCAVVAGLQAAVASATTSTRVAASLRPRRAWRRAVCASQR
jgi:hypothetical protein